jgi:hypothetical protein
MTDGRSLDLQQHCELADRVLELVRTRIPQGPAPDIRDWNDVLLVEAFGRAFRCLRSIRELAGRREGDDAAVVTRALIGLTLRYLWLATVDDPAERHNRLQRLQLTWARDRAILGEELIGLGYMPDDEAGRESVAQFRARADQLERDGIGRVVDREIALQLDRELEPTTPKIFELMYALIYRQTSDVAHYGIGTALAGYLSKANRETVVTLDEGDEERAASRSASPCRRTWRFSTSPSQSSGTAAQQTSISSSARYSTNAPASDRAEVWRLPRGDAGQSQPSGLVAAHCG